MKDKRIATGGCVVALLGMYVFASVGMFGSPLFGLPSMLTIGAKMHEPMWLTLFVWSICSGLFFILAGFAMAYSGIRRSVR